MATPIKVAAEITEVISHAPDLRTYVLRPSRRVPAFVPGQALHLAMDPYEPGSHWPDSRVFSIASGPQDREQLRITISRQGAFTSRVFDELVAGRTVWIKLPYGTFCPNPDLPGRTVLLAGGSGVTPFVSFLEWAASARPTAAIDLHYGARSSALLIYRPAIEHWQAQSLTHLRTCYYVEQPGEAPTHDSSVVVGRVSPELAWTKLEDPRRCRFYLSGPQAMIVAFRAQLVGLGAPPESVLSDDWV